MNTAHYADCFVYMTGKVFSLTRLDLLGACTSVFLAVLDPCRPKPSFLTWRRLVPCDEGQGILYLFRGRHTPPWAFLLTGLTWV